MGLSRLLALAAATATVTIATSLPAQTAAPAPAKTPALAAAYLTSANACEPSTWTPSAEEKVGITQANADGMIARFTDNVTNCFAQVDKALVDMTPEQQQKFGIDNIASHRMDLARRKTAALAAIMPLFRSMGYNPATTFQLKLRACSDETMPRDIDAVAREGAGKGIAYYKTRFNPPNIRTTEEVERAITQIADVRQRCLANVRGQMTAVSGGDTIEGLAADVERRGKSARADVDAYFRKLGYVKSSAKAPPVPGYFFCQIEFRKGERLDRFISRIMVDPDSAETWDDNSQTPYVTAFQRKFYAWVMNLKLTGTPLSEYEDEQECYADKDRADVQEDFQRYVNAGYQDKFVYPPN